MKRVVEGEKRSCLVRRNGSVDIVPPLAAPYAETWSLAVRGNDCMALLLGHLALYAYWAEEWRIVSIFPTG